MMRRTRSAVTSIHIVTKEKFAFYVCPNTKTRSEERAEVVLCNNTFDGYPTMTPPVATTLQRAIVAIVERTKATALKSPTNAFDM